MRIAIPQLNYHTGNLQKNMGIMLNAIEKAKTEKADLIIFPELAICGPFPQDLLEQEDFINQCRINIEKLAIACNPSLAAIIGGPNLDNVNGIMYNSAYFIQNGEVTDGVHKTILSDYDIFNESRYFIAGEDNSAIRFRNKNIRILFDEYESEYIDKNDDIVIYIGIAPFTTESLEYKQHFLSAISKKYNKITVSVNACGASTSIIMDGNSMIYNAKGCLVHQSKAFKEDFSVITLNPSMPILKNIQENRMFLIQDALITGIQDFFQKNNFSRAILGLSGGIDSAVVAALTAEAIGPSNVLGILMPSIYSTDHSIKDAKDLVQNIGMPFEIIEINDIYSQYLTSLAPIFNKEPFNVAEENLQARTRGALIMAISNKFGYIPLNTSNKSEIAVGYGTLYGDMCGSLSIIGDVYKTEVYKLATHINREKIIIPESTIHKAPSAELRPDQKDQDSLPDYHQLDKILKLYLEDNQTISYIIKQGFSPGIVNKIIQLINRSEYKKVQCAPTLKISKKAFGNGRRIPF